MSDQPKRKSRRDFIQKPYFKKSHNAMYVDIDGKPRRLCAGDKLTPEGGELYHKALADRGKEPEFTQDADSELTLIRLVDDFLASVQSQVKRGKLAQRTFDWYDEHLQRFAKFIGGTMTVTGFKKSHLAKWLERDYADAGDNYLNGAVRAVSRVYNWAKEEERVSINPVAGFKRASYQARECYLTDDQWQLVIAELKEDDPFADFVWFLYLTGCRPHEARTAKNWHFDRETNSLVFERVNSKGKKSRRVILLEGKALQIVQRRAGDNFIFTNRRGNAWSSYALNCRFSRVREQLAKKGHQFDVFPYIFRHTFITNALKRGLNPLTVAAIVGHCDATMIMRVYSHLCQDNAHLRAELRRAVG